MLFGQYLVKTGLITEEQLLEGLVLQLESQPSIAEVAYKCRLLPTDKLLSIFHFQAIENIGFIDACKKVDVEISDLLTKYETELIRMRRPIGEILVQLEYVEAKQVILALDEYFETEHLDKEKEEVNTDSESAVVIRTQEVKKEAEPIEKVTKEAAVEASDSFTGDLSVFAEGLSIETIVEHFQSEKEFADVAATLSYWEEGYNLVHFLRGFLRFQSLQNLDDLLKSLEESLRHLARDVGNISTENAQAMQKLCVKTLSKIHENIPKLLESENNAAIFAEVNELPDWAEFREQFDTFMENK